MSIDYYQQKADARRLNEMQRRIEVLERLIQKVDDLDAVQITVTDSETEETIILSDISDLPTLAGKALTLSGTTLKVEVNELIPPNATQETHTIIGVMTNPLDLTNISYENLSMSVDGGTYTSATVQLQISGDGTTWDVVEEYDLLASETFTRTLKLSALHAKFELTAFVGTNIIMTLGAIV